MPADEGVLRILLLLTGRVEFQIEADVGDQRDLDRIAGAQMQVATADAAYLDIAGLDYINISGLNGALRLSASYAVKIPMVANISLYLEFEPNSGN